MDKDIQGCIDLIAKWHKSDEFERQDIEIRYTQSYGWYFCKAWRDGRDNPSFLYANLSAYYADAVSPLSFENFKQMLIDMNKQ